MENRATCKNTGIGTIQKEFGTSFVPESTRYAKMNQTMPKDHRRQLKRVSTGQIQIIHQNVVVLSVFCECMQNTDTHQGRMEELSPLWNATCKQTASVTEIIHGWANLQTEIQFKKRISLHSQKFFPIKYLKCWWEKW